MELDQAQLLKTISSFLDSHDIPYMLTGAWSVVYYGRPRASHDIDFVVELYDREIDRVLGALQKLPTEFSVQPLSVREAIKQKGMFNIIHLPTYLKLDFWLLSDTPFDLSRFNRRQRIELLDQPMTISSSEDTILQKLNWYKEAKIEKHLVDAAFVYQIQHKSLNMAYIEKWAKTLSVTRYLKKLDTIDLEKYL